MDRSGTGSTRLTLTQKIAGSSPAGPTFQDFKGLYSDLYRFAKSPVAQLVSEQLTLNQWVLGSSPSGGTSIPLSMPLGHGKLSVQGIALGQWSKILRDPRDVPEGVLRALTESGFIPSRGIRNDFGSRSTENQISYDLEVYLLSLIRS